MIILKIKLKALNYKSDIVFIDHILNISNDKLNIKSSDILSADITGDSFKLNNPFRAGVKAMDFIHHDAGLTFLMQSSIYSAELVLDDKWHIIMIEDGKECNDLEWKIK